MHFCLFQYTGSAIQCSGLHLWICYWRSSAVCDRVVPHHWILCKDLVVVSSLLLCYTSLLHTAASSLGTEVHTACWTVLGWRIPDSLRVLHNIASVGDKWVFCVYQWGRSFHVRAPHTHTHTHTCTHTHTHTHTHRFVSMMPSQASFLTFSFLLRIVGGIGTAMYATASYTQLTLFYPDKKGTIVVSGSVQYPTFCWASMSPPWSVSESIIIDVVFNRTKNA